MLVSSCLDESYITNNAYQGAAEDEISFETGVVVTIIQKSLDGWWKVRYGATSSCQSNLVVRNCSVGVLWSSGLVK